MLINLNTSASGGLDAGPYVGALGSEIPTGGDFPAFLLNDIDPAYPNRRYRLLVEAPSAGELYLSRVSDGYFKNAPPSTYTAGQTIKEYDEGVGLSATKVGTYSLTVLGAVVDNTPPVMAGGLTFSSITQTGFSVNWQAATDNVSVTGYDVDNGSGTYVSVDNVLTLAVTGKSASTVYLVRVRARDAAGNVSAALAATATTASIPDTAAPTMNGTLTVSNVESSGFTMSWPAASDNIGVAGYDVDDGGGSFVNVGNVLSYLVTGKNPVTQYTVRVRARDAAGNVAQMPLSIVVTTAAIPPGILQSGPPTIVQLSSTGGKLKLSVTFTDTPAPRSRTIVMGGSTTTITSG